MPCGDAFHGDGKLAGGSGGVHVIGGYMRVHDAARVFGAAQGTPEYFPACCVLAHLHLGQPHDALDSKQLKRFSLLGEPRSALRPRL